MLHSKFVALNLVKAAMIALIFFSCLPSSKADEVDTLIQKLKDKDYDVRYKAAVALGKMGTPAVEPLIAALKDEDPNVRRKAAEALWGIKDARAVEPLVAALKDLNPNVRMVAADALGEIKDARAVEPLVAALKDKEPNVRMVAANALVEIKDARAVEPLVAALKDENLYVRRAVAKVLVEIKDARVVEPLIENLTDWHSNSVVAEALSNIGWKPQSERDKIHFLVARRNDGALKKDWDITKDVLLKDVVCGNYGITENALYAFIGIGKEEIIPELIKKLNEGGDKTMAEAYLNCGHSGLGKAAREWASSHGYSISTGSGNAPVGWGRW